MRIVVLSGAGMSADSGIRTFRDADGLWENHRIEDVATPEAWHRNPALVLDFYNARRKQLFDVAPNAGHIALKQLELLFDVQIITQNVDDLHERAGSTKVMHLHGELRKVRSTYNQHWVKSWTEDVHLGDLCPKGGQLRPHIVWFGEEVPLISDAAALVMEADRIIVVGSSMQVYPAAGLIIYANSNTPIWYIDPNPQINNEMRSRKDLTIISERSALALPELVHQWLSE